MTMKTSTLRYLLSLEENPKLEFKSAWYKIYDADPETKKRQKHELIKDILALTNGSVATPGDIGYLIIGPGDSLYENGTRSLTDLRGVKLPAADEVLELVNPFCSPAIDNIQCERVEFNKTVLFVISIPPSPHLHETTRPLECSKQTFSKHVTLIRHNSDIEIASAKERDAIIQAKSRYFFEKAHASSAQLVSLVVGSGFGMSGIKDVTDDWLLNQTIGAIIGSSIGYVSGYPIGKYNEYLDRGLLKSRARELLWSFIAFAVAPFIVASLWAIANELLLKLWALFPPSMHGKDTKNYIEKKKELHSKNKK